MVLHFAHRQPLAVEKKKRREREGEREKKEEECAMSCDVFDFIRDEI